MIEHNAESVEMIDTSGTHHNLGEGPKMGHEILQVQIMLLLLDLYDCNSTFAREHVFFAVSRDQNFVRCSFSYSMK